MNRIYAMLCCLIMRFRYARVARRIRRTVGNGRPVRVLFLDSEVAKWKTKSLVDRLCADSHYHVIIGITRRDGYERKSPAEIRDGMDRARKYYESRGYECVDVFDAERKSYIDLRRFSPDFVFYQQSWYNCFEHRVRKVARFAITCYVPYYVMDYGSPEVDIWLPFHREIAYNFHLSQEWIDALMREMPRYAYCGKNIAVGHTILDQIKPTKPPIGRPCVIYAPHFSFVWPGVEIYFAISTFLDTGRCVLAYAQQHPEMDWVFKPHPKLRRQLVDTGAWTSDEVDDYFKAWASFATVSLDSDYIKYFDQATCMVTDSGSFLTEFAVTEKPIIRLIPSHDALVPMAPSRRLFESFYQAQNESELVMWLKTIAEEGLDPKKSERLSVLHNTGIGRTNAAVNIHRLMNSICGIPDCESAE